MGVSAGTAVGIASGVVGGLLLLWHVGIWYEVDVKCEKPKYTLLQTLKTSKRRSVELRRYAPYLMAEVTSKDATMRDALSSGFRQIAGFIFGKNTVVGGTESTKVAMTSPVTCEVPQSAKIAMTSPVTAETSSTGEYKVSFIMPSNYTKDTLPKPLNDNVQILEMPSRTLAALTWRGRSPSEEGMYEKAEELRAALKESGFRTIGSVHLWQYHPPFAPAWMRKNEVLLEVDETSAAS